MIDDFTVTETELAGGKTVIEGRGTQCDYLVWGKAPVPIPVQVKNWVDEEEEDQVAEESRQVVKNFVRR